MNEEQAREHIKELKDYYAHLAAFVGVNLFLFMVNMVNLAEGDDIWFIYPLFGWGIGLIIHTFGVFWNGKNWEAQKMNELTGLSQTQDELARLSERTENLVTILSSVNWEKIDPDLLGTRQSLEEAREKIVQLKSERDPEGERLVNEEVQKLEAFVTSSRFDYYQLAAEDKKS
ncbi:MAG: 2TM domain-containing protein [Proteobacteria bacterium]|nr:2TM domain-containing protein [Pseudomonadota bacterium]